MAMIKKEGIFALLAFLIYFYSCLTLIRTTTFTSWQGLINSLAFIALSWFVMKFLPHFEVVKRAAFLGCVFGFSVVLSFSGLPFQHFGWYMASLSFFHFSEYIMTAIYNPDTLTTDSFLLNHSREYKLAAIASWIEFAVEYFFFPNLKQTSFINELGLLLLIGGEIVRKLAMITAKSNFSHIVQFQKKDGHVLVQHGIYNWFRHPSYFGWFWWSIGTQLTLSNPICLVVYAWASWNFFKERIEVEEVTLLNFFQQEYVDYQKRVGTGLPFIKGYLVSEEINSKKDK
ncbi:protein-S-isoprenylcysteine O-methyltransferase-like [Actinia tenebrosa]|uniref:Protein-S-isoprenylcysteine O-methyltransferase n=1 Tax=Actinia tenebrosa TaxID=6105 RepID=A0A6P8JD67_ACTTE|nr:protein-S-isoprenylcysteine O-methyltransferase-like [Actinia tenebrosa]